MKTVTTRIPEDDEEVLSQLQEELGADRAEVLRRLITEGLDEWRVERALEEIRDGSVTIRTAAEMADVSYVEMLTLARDEGIDVGGYDVEDLERDLDRL